MIDEDGRAWERKLLEKLASDALIEQRRRRRWSVFFKLLGFAYLTMVLIVAIDWPNSNDGLPDGKKYTALVRLTGVIAARGSASAENIIAGLKAAYEDKRTAGVILLINSPGGSPVQAGIINDEITRLRKLHPEVPLHAVVEDVCASGGYYVAAGADNIYVNKASIVGSIGVLMDGFGFTGSMEKLGVERRLLTAGANKGFLDPFSPQSEQQKAHAQEMLGEIHQQFIKVVRDGRGKRLSDTPELFSGLMWTGARSIELGLVDDFGSLESVARDVIGEEAIRDFTVEPNFAEKLAKRFGAETANGFWNTLSQYSIH